MIFAHSDLLEKKEKKVQKEIATILESNGDVKDKLTEIFSRFQKLVSLIE